MPVYPDLLQRAQGRPLLLDLFCCAGGAGYGYRLAGFYVVGVDIKPQSRYAGDEFYQNDALAFVAAYGWMFDVIHASPPCQGFSRLTPIQHKGNYANLITPTRSALQATGKPYVIENVPDAVRFLVNPLMLCGSMFGLRIFRHRYFECSWDMLFSPFSCCHDFAPVYISGCTSRKSGRKEFPVSACREASGIDWMTRKELDEAIPPAYTHFIGRQLITVVMNHRESEVN